MTKFAFKLMISMGIHYISSGDELAAFTLEEIFIAFEDLVFLSYEMRQLYVFRTLVTRVLQFIYEVLTNFT